MACVFCGGRPTTNEHVFPRWLERFLAEDRRQRLELTRYGEGGYDVALDKIGLDIRVNSVCAECNNGWMSSLEGDSINVLTPLIAGLDDVVLLSLPEQRQISLWATKTAMMADQTQAVPLLSFAQRSRLRTHRAIPGGTRVWIGACDAMNPIVTSQTVRSELERLDDADAPRITGFYTPMKIGHLCLYVFFPQADVVVQHPPIYRTATARIWPRRRSDLPVPAPVRPRTGVEFEEFADAFYHAMLVSSADHAARYGIREF
jgi:hypothetical protein